MKAILFLFTVMILVVGCSDSDFQGAAPTKKKAADATPVNKTIQLTCDQVTGASRLKTSLEGEQAVQVAIEGELCGIQGETESQALSVFLILDFSGSMAELFNGPGNDPLVGDSCGRLQAAEAIAAKMEKSNVEGLELKLGAMQFATGALTHIPMTDLAAFKASLTAGNFCGATTSTNYQAAFNEAKAQLEQLTGQKLVYFITDGAPSAPTGQAETPQELGLAAAEDFRSSIEDLTLNAVFLNKSGDPSGGTPDNPTFNAEEYLKHVVGDPDRVKLVQNAADLADKILQFETPDPVILKPETANMVHAAAKFGEQEVKIQSLQPHSTKEGVWTFVTEPILLYAARGQSVTNKITLDVKTSDGKEHRAEVEIDFEHLAPLED